MKQSKREMRKYFEMNKNKNTTYQNVQNPTKTVLRGKLIPVSAYSVKEKNQYANLPLQEIRRVN